jgi:hypothetical protein
MCLISPDKVVEFVPILNMNNVSIMPPTCVTQSGRGGQTRPHTQHEQCEYNAAHMCLI